MSRETSNQKHVLANVPASRGPPGTNSPEVPYIVYAIKFARSYQGVLERTFL